MPYAQVVFNIAVPRTFTYHIPDNFVSAVMPGVLVLAPFGKRELTGVVVACSDRTTITGLKDIIDVTEDTPLVSDDLLQLTSWIAEYYACAWGQAIQLALPRGLEQKSILKVVPVTPAPSGLAQITDRQRELYDHIFRVPDRDTKYYRQRYGTGSFYHSLRALEEKGLIRLNWSLSDQRVSRTFERYVVIPESVPDNFYRLRDAVPLRKLLNEHAGQTYTFSTFTEISGLSADRIRTLHARGIIGIESREKKRTPQFSYSEEKREITLNPGQRNAVEKITASLTAGNFGVFLLHGVTGSGKTQVYIESIRKALALGKKALVLIPEISLTPQTAGRFENEFPGRVAVFHSRLSLGERYDTWRLVKAGACDIVVGPRSALFMPLKDTGVYIIDEEHDGSYKQNDPAPRYHARDVAVYLARKQNAAVILGSATPSVESYYNALNKKYHLLELKSRINDIPMPEVAIVDMRRGERLSGKLHHISPFLEEKIRTALEKGEQAIILQNRRGFASFIQCKDCGHIPECPNCAVACTYHAYNQTLQCHYCGTELRTDLKCSRCGGEAMQYKGVGTEKIEKELRTLFPQARLLRMDLDTTGRKGAHDRLLQAFKSRVADILLGTQMIAKGLDFEPVTIVGVIAAEVGVGLPDFRASERVFQLLTQVAGRAGRGKRSGIVVIQSFSDQFPAIRHAREHDFTGFYDQEIRRREKTGYPPFSRLILIRVSAPQAAEALRAAGQIASRLRTGPHRMYRVLGPAPAPFIRLKNMYRWHVVLKINTDMDRSGARTKKIINDRLGNDLQKFRSATRVIVDVHPLDML
jgi:primosomal protein N' (replication factor Y)